jgi:hypothetical protein
MQGVAIPAAQRSVVVLAAAVMLVARVAGAEPSQADRALAQSLFDEARVLMDAKKFAQACPKLAESDRLDPGGGTLLNLAVCHEGEGKLARAWVELNDALSRAVRDGRKDREDLAREHISGLANRVPRVRIVLADVDARVDARVTLDGEQVRSLSSPLAVDPGAHVLVVAAPGKREARVNIDVAADGKVRDVLVPALANAPAEAARQLPADGSGRRTTGLIVGGAGIAAIGVGAFFGVSALSKRSDADALCPEKRCSNPDGVALQDEAITAAWIANVAIGAGLVALGIGGYLVLTAAPDGKSAQIGASIPLF